jgi:signal transduction histidine kinase
MSEPRHVSTRVTSNAIEAMDAVGWPGSTPDLSTLGVPEALLRSREGWISWGRYMAFLELLAGPGSDLGRHREAGRRLMRHNASTPFRNIAGMVGGLRQLYRAIFGWVTQGNVRPLTTDVRSITRERVLVEFWLAPDQQSGEPFFHSVAGTLECTPGLMGLADARVEATIGSHQARYEVILPQERSFAGLARRAWRSTFKSDDETELTLDYMRESMESALVHLQDTNRRLLDSEARWRALADHLPGMVLILDRTGEVRALHGAELPPGGLEVGDDALGIFTAEDQQLMRALLGRVFEEGARVEYETHTGPSAATPGRWWSFRAGPLPGEGELVVVVATDVTERRASEQALKDSEARFLQAQKLEAVGRLAGGLAHDFNNVLAAVQGQAELIQQRRPGDEELGRAMESILASVARASGLTRRLLTHGRQQPADPEPIDLVAYVEDAVPMLSSLVGGDVRLEIRTCRAPAVALLDRILLEQVLLNLAVNARDAMPDGGTLTLCADSLLLDGPGGALRFAQLSVSDDGVGMDAAVLARAIEPFFSTKPATRGSGLGLFSVHRIVQDAGGQLRIESAPGAGTTVRVRFPQVAGAAPRTAPPSPAAVLQGSGQRLLLVEDQAEVRQMLEQLLTQQGYRVLACPTPAAALATVEGLATPIDALVTDMVMPEMSGVELASRLAAWRPVLPVLLISGFTEEDPRGLTEVTSRYAFLSKPFRLRELSEALGALLAPEDGE